MTWLARIQPRPLSAAPSAISSRGPNLSISQPWPGAAQVCRMTRMEKVTWIAGKPLPVALTSESVKRVQTY